MDKNILGTRIQEERKKRKLTQEKFAELCGIGKMYLGEIERGQKMPSLNIFIKILNYFDLSADAVLRDELVASKPHVFNEMTEKVKDLTPKQLKIVNDVVSTLADNFLAANLSEAGDEDEED